MNQWLALVLSFAYIFAFIGLAGFLQQRLGLRAGVSRKIVHIGVAHWWLIALVGIDNLAVALIGPLSFIVLNTVSYRMRLFKSIEHEAQGANLGTVYFPIALSVLVFLCWGGYIPFVAGTVGMMVLGWGDGLAALVGEGPGRHRFSLFGGEKSLEGTLVMGFVSALVAWLSFVAMGTDPALGLVAVSLIVGVAAGIIEFLTPWGIDNLSVPLLTALIVAVLG